MNSRNAEERSVDGEQAVGTVVYRPIPTAAGGIVPAVDRATSIEEARQRDSLKGATRGADLYFATMALTWDERGAGFVDAGETWHPVPSSARTVRRVFIRDNPSGGRVTSMTYVFHALVFFDAEGALVLKLPDYGWSIEHHLVPWCRQADLVLDPAELVFEGKAAQKLEGLPRYYKTPGMDLGLTYREPRRMFWQRR